MAKKRSRVPEILEEMAGTYRERNAAYGDSYKRQAAIMKILFPEGLQAKTEEDWVKVHLIDHIVIKLTRFANSKMTHKDSVHDLAVYAAIMESEVE